MKRGFVKSTFLTDRIFDRVIFIIIILILIMVVYPLVFIVSASISEPTRVAAGDVILLPKEIIFDGYSRIFNTGTIWTGYRNTFVYVILGTTISVILTLMAAYPLSKKDLVGRNVFTFIIVFTMFFNGGLIPTYLLVKSLEMYNSIWAMIIPNAVGVWNVIISRTYFQSTIPQELYDAAHMDGCTNWKSFIKIVIPLSKPVVAVITLFYSVWIWNNYFDAIIYLSDFNLFPLQLILRSILVENHNFDLTGDIKDLLEMQRAAELVRYGVIIVSSVPILCFYPFLQKYFVKGIMIGSLKG